MAQLKLAFIIRIGVARPSSYIICVSLESLAWIQFSFDIEEPRRELLYAGTTPMARIPLDSHLVIVCCTLSGLDWVVKVPVCRRWGLQAATVNGLLSCAGL